jgi:AAA domain
MDRYDAEAFLRQEDARERGGYYSRPKGADASANGGGDVDGDCAPADAGLPGDLRTYTSVAAWLERDIPEPDFLLGQVLSTTNRGILIADTGLGKTNLAMAMAAAIANGGNGFLHWRCRGLPARVLIIEGEMSLRLVKRRLGDMTRRAGDVPPTLYVVSRSDPRFTDMPPLNIEDGQKYIDAVIAQLGGVDFIIFDNVQALLIGDMKDELPWQQTLPWVRSLTNQNIGQLWVHHTGHNTAHSYGTKTREWQLDFVILLEEVERKGADIAFSLKFTKARECSPDNKADFEPTVIRLAKDQWTAEASKAIGALSPTGRLWYEALLDAFAANVIPGKTTRVAWYSEAVRTNLAEAIGPDDTRTSRDKKLSRLRKYSMELRTAGLIGIDGDTVTHLRKSR